MDVPLLARHPTGLPEPSGTPSGSYWDGFYRNRRGLPGPSSFAHEVAADLAAPTAVLELGCGDGADAGHFAALGHDVLGLDASAAAIGRAGSRGTAARFEALALAEARPAMERHLRAAPAALVYARFLLHAVPQAEADALLRDLALALPPGAALAFEYRTLADAALPKLFPPHFRRFVDHAALQRQLAGLGFAVTDASEGQGRSPLGGEDPVLGRLRAVRR